MDYVQMQVEYGLGKVKKFNVPEKPCTLEELKGDIQCHVMSLMGKDFEIYGR